MHLCIDIGNTRAKLGLYDPAPGRQEWAAVWERDILTASWLSSLPEFRHVTAAILSHTRDYEAGLDELLAQLPHYIRLDHHTPVPVSNQYETPETLGRDRLAGICGARALYPQRNVLVIDAGTCITLDLVTEAGEYFGGSIHPGINMRFQALNNYTGKLPLIQRRNAAALFGRSTEGSILAGVEYAVLREIEGMIDDYAARFSELKVIITGGDSAFFVSQSKKEIFAHANLVLTGLNKILEYNVAGL